MSKTPPAELREIVTSQLITYLQNGALNPDRITGAFDYSATEIENFQTLKRLHFVLYSDVVEYIERLPERLRRIKTEQQRMTTQSRGEVRGQINWKETIQQRSQSGYVDRTVFMTDNPRIEVDIPENRVVKKLLAVISEPLRQEIQGLEQDWRAMWDDSDIIHLRRTLAQNVHLDALPPAAEMSLSDRDLTTARRARQPLYYDAARLYQLYRDLMNDRFDLESVQDLLRSTIIAPLEDHKMFELFCLFAVVQAVRHRIADDLSLKRIQPGDDEIAELESSNRLLQIYYDKGGPLSFYSDYPKPADLPDPTGQDDFYHKLYRQSQALETHSELVDEFLSGGSNHSFYSGRPDFLILDWDTRTDQSLREAIIGEAKYTVSQSTFSTGLRELIEYIHFAEFGGEFLFDEILNRESVRGILCTDGVHSAVTEAGNVQHITTDRMQAEFGEHSRDSPDRLK